MENEVEPTNLIALAAFGLIITASYWAGGKITAFFVAAGILLFIAYALEGKTLKLRVRTRLSSGLARLSSSVEPKPQPVVEEPEADADDHLDDFFETQQELGDI